MKYNNFHYALSLLNTLYGINMEEEDFEEIALIGWGKIGNKILRLYRFKVDLDSCSDGEVELPCNVDEIEAVTLGNIEEWAYSTNDTPNGNINSAYTEQYIENRKSFRHPMYVPGKYVRYEQIGNKLKFDRPHGTVYVLYKGTVVDDDGLPEITDKEASALATYVAWIHMQKEAFKSRNRDTLTFAQSLKNDWLTACDLARVGYYMSLNEWDLVLDVRSSWNRKMYGRSLKVYQI